MDDYEERPLEGGVTVSKVDDNVLLLRRQILKDGSLGAVTDRIVLYPAAQIELVKFFEALVDWPE